MRRLFAAYRREYARAYDMLHAARLVSPGGIPGILTAEAKARVRKRAEVFAEKAVHRSEAEEYEKRRFLSAYTCRGAVLLSATAASFGRVYTLDNELGLADEFLQAVLERARSAGAARIVCPDPVDPEKLAALILPEDFERVRALGNPVSDIVAQWLEFFYKFHRSIGYAGAPMHDPCAVMALIHPEIFTIRPMYVQIETAGEYCRGTTVGDLLGFSGHAPNADVLMDVDRGRFADLLVEAIKFYGEAEA